MLGSGGQAVFHNRGSINGRYGLSIAAGELEPHQRLAVLELAADSFDEIRDLAELTKPQVGVLTAINEAHLATFGSLAAIAVEKGRLLEVLPPYGLAVLNADDPHTLALSAKTQAHCVTVGLSPYADLRADDVTVTPKGLLFRISDSRDWLKDRHAGIDSDRFSMAIRSNLLGRHQIPLLLSLIHISEPTRPY